MFRLSSSLYTSIIFLAILVVAWINIWLSHHRDLSKLSGGGGVVSVAGVFELRGSSNQSNTATTEHSSFFSSVDWVGWLREGSVHAGEEVPEHDSVTGNVAALKASLEEQQQNHVQAKSRYAYTTLISGLDKTYKYRGFLYNALIMHRALRRFGSRADFVAMVALNAPSDEDEFRADLDLLRQHGIIVHILQRMVDGANALGFAEMALLKVTPWSFLQYERVQFLDGDVMPTANMDCFFALTADTFTIGAVSPLNSGWYLAIPNMEAHDYMRAKAIDRLHRDWDKVEGWGDRLPGTDKARGAEASDMLTTRGGHKRVSLWDFNGADMDQGLCTQYFVLSRGNAVLVDTDLNVARLYQHSYLARPALAIKAAAATTKATAAVRGEVVPPKVMPAAEALKCCDGRSPILLFVHFTGRSKPWMNIPPLEDIRRYLQPTTVSVTDTATGEVRQEQRMRLVARGGLFADPAAGAPGRKRGPLIGANVLQWLQYLDELDLPGGINSTTVGALGLGSPLGFFNAKFPKGGFAKATTA